MKYIAREAVVILLVIAVLPGGLLALTRGGTASGMLRRLDDGIALRLPSQVVHVRVCDARTLRIVVLPSDSVKLRPSLVIRKVWGRTAWRMHNDGRSVIVSTSLVKASVDMRTGSISFLGPRGDTLLYEDRSRPHDLVPAVVAGEKVVHIIQRFRLSPEEGIYGLGQFENGVLNYRNSHVTLIQNNRHVVVPFLVSSRRYGIYWDNYSHTEYTDSAGGMSLWSEVADGIDYYFMRGANLDEVVGELREASGRVPMWPRWAFGYWQSKERYENQNELMGVAREYRRRHIPIDNVVLDWQYWGKLGWNAMAFDSSLFPDPRGMIDSLHRIYKMQIMISVWPQVDTATALYQELERKKLLYPTQIWNGGKTYDAYSREAREIFWRYLDRGLYSLGIDAWWVDATEPDWKWCDSLREEKEGIVRNGMTALGTSSRYLNTYALMATEGLYQNQRAANPSRRVVMLTRSAFAGQQRNSMAVWSGDISSNWATFRNQIAAGINFSMAGIPYWNSDIGGFLPKEFGGEYPLGPRDPAYRELYVRWFQFGAFCPVFRSHGTDFPREVWRFGEPGDWAYDALLKSLRLRYRLLPYIYSVAWEVTSKHFTMMRGLPMDFPGDPRALSEGTEYLFGPSFLVAPVTVPMYNPKQWGVVVPASVLRTDHGEPGLRGEYFHGVKFDTLQNVRSDSLVRFDWTASPPRGLGHEDFSVRWSGELRAPESGRYEFEVISDDGVNLFVGGKQLLDEMYFGGRQMNVGEIELNADSVYQIRLEYYQEKGPAEVTFTWRTPSMLASYRSTAGICSSTVYLPRGAEWYDFWTGERYRGGQEIRCPAPTGIIPLYVRGGSIVPMGPHLEFTGEEPADTLEIRVYPGSDGSFTLYEDEADGYGYEEGKYAEIPFRWLEKSESLLIGRRVGGFSGMLPTRLLRIVRVGKGKGTGLEPSPSVQAVVRYTGEQVRVKLGATGG